MSNPITTAFNAITDALGITDQHEANVAVSLDREAHKATDRSDKWPTVEHHFKKDNPSCAACGFNSDMKLLQIHHEKPFHLHPELELDPTNLIALCMGPKECHLKIGHGDDFKEYNPDVRSDAAEALADLSKRADIVARAKTARLR